MRAEAVIFDLGNVLLSFDYSIAISKMLSLSRISEQELHALINQSPLLYQFETGLIDSNQFFDEVRKGCGFSGDFEEFSEQFGNIFSPIEPMLQIERALAGQGVRRYIFSNTNELAISHIRRHFPFFGNFDGYFLSYEHRMMKPNPRLYSLIESILKLRGPEILYIDDREENLVPAADLSWRVIHHSEPAKTRKLLQETGML